MAVTFTFAEKKGRAVICGIPGTPAKHQPSSAGAFKELCRRCLVSEYCFITSGNEPNVLNAMLSNQRMCEERSSLVFLPTASLASLISPMSSKDHLHLDSNFSPLPLPQPACTQPSSDLWLLIAPSNQFVTSKLSNSLPSYYARFCLPVYEH